MGTSGGAKEKITSSRERRGGPSFRELNNMSSAAADSAVIFECGALAALIRVSGAVFKGYRPHGNKAARRSFSWA